MVSIMTAAIAASAGFMIYLAIPVLVMNAGPSLRQRVGTFYFKLAARSLKQFTFVRRVLSGYDVLPISVDNEQKLLQVTLSSSTIGSSDKFRFADPDNRIKRLYNKPVAVAFELVPAAIDATISEWGYWAQEKKNNEGFWSADYMKEPDAVEVDPYIEASDDLRLVDPIDAHAIVSNDVDAENIKTAEKKTKKRFEKYKGGIGLAQTMRVAIGFAIGAGGFVGIQYFNEEVMGSGGGSGGTIVGSEQLMVDATSLAIDMAVMIA